MVTKENARKADMGLVKSSLTAGQRKDIEQITQMALDREVTSVPKERRVSVVEAAVIATAAVCADVFIEASGRATPSDDKLFSSLTSDEWEKVKQTTINIMNDITDYQNTLPERRKEGGKTGSSTA